MMKMLLILPCISKHTVIKTRKSSHKVVNLALRNLKLSFVRHTVMIRSQNMLAYERLFRNLLFI